jgi:predicted metal-dependent phosphoesterase TrpH
MVIDLHTHTSRHSCCSVLSPTDLVKEACLRGLDGIVITEHNYKWPNFEIERLRESIENANIVILSGQEVRAYIHDFPVGDILAFGFYGNLGCKKLKAEQIIKLIHSEGGIAVAAHPYRDILGFGDVVYSLDFDAIEVYNSNHTEDDTRKAIEASSRLNLPALAGSDAHDSRVVAKYFTHFNDTIQKEEDLIAAIKAGRCRPCKFETYFGKSTA